MPKHDSELITAGVSPRERLSEPPSLLRVFGSSFLGRHPFLFVFLAAVVPRVLLGLFAPDDGLDWPIVYRIVADNIYLNHCVSQSPPLSAACAPH